MHLLQNLFGEKQNIIYRIVSVFFTALVLSIGVYFIAKGFDQRYFKYDSWGYYIYLPAFFIHHDPLTLGHASTVMWRYSISHEFYQAIRLPDGHYVFGYTGGVALMELPFFIIAHSIAHMAGLLADGYSGIYQIFIICSGIFWGLMGSLFIYDVLTRYFAPRIAILTCLCLILATNLFNYMFWENGMTHVYSFFLFSALIRFSFVLFERPTYRVALLTGLAMGFIIMIRPTNLLMALPVFFIAIPLSADGVSGRMRFLAGHVSYIALAAVAAVLPFTIQMIYWRWATGHFLFNPYAYTGQGFDFRHPHLFFGILGVHKGWLFYTPVMILALAGLVLRPVKSPLSAAVLSVYLAIHIWITYSWSTYDYGGCFGARSMIDTYPLLAIPLAICIETILRRKWMYPLIISLLLICSGINVFQTWKYQKGYLSVTGYGLREATKSYFNYDGYNADATPYVGANAQPILETVLDKKHLVNAQNPYSGEVNLPIGSLPGSYSDYILRIAVTGRYPHLDILRGKKNAALVFSQENNGAAYCWMFKAITAQTIDGDTAVQHVVYDKRLVTPVSPADRVKCYVVDYSANAFEIDTIRVSVYRK